MADIPVDNDGVPIAGPMRDFIIERVKAASDAARDRFHQTGIIVHGQLRGDLRQVKMQAIQEWKSEHPDKPDSE